MKSRKIFKILIILCLIFLLTLFIISRSFHDRDEGNYRVDIEAPVPTGRVVSISCGFYHNLVLCDDGTVQAWGRNNTGQLGNGANISPDNPVQVLNLRDVIAVSGGGLYSLALRGDGTVWAWGANNTGQLGNGTHDDSNVPVRVSNLNDVIAVSAGGSYAFATESHSLALRKDGTIWAWGWNGDGQLGDGTKISRNIPVRVLNLDNVIAISAGGSHSLALREDGTVWAWGANVQGQLGNGTYINSDTPVQVSNLDDVIAISAGIWHSLALREDGTVWAWGWNGDEQLGDGEGGDAKFDDKKNIPVPVLNLNDVIGIATGKSHSLALCKDGTIWAWGWNGRGQLGNGTNEESSNIPGRVLNLDNVIAISGGIGHSLALCNDGTVWAWGANNFGEIGDGTLVDKNIPTRIF
ncbi:MAG: RCC1 repeat- and reductase domain-containing protein [Candidatus Eremiobacteraeota bacterium]|nr:RCC1 repeat- and reductase domain-containing protein [Candidatus Eremiobacteraeota bacterium]